LLKPHNDYWNDIAAFAIWYLLPGQQQQQQQQQQQPSKEVEGGEILPRSVFDAAKRAMDAWHEEWERVRQRKAFSAAFTRGVEIAIRETQLASTRDAVTRIVRSFTRAADSCKKNGALTVRSVVHDAMSRVQAALGADFKLREPYWNDIACCAVQILLQGQLQAESGGSNPLEAWELVVARVLNEWRKEMEEWKLKSSKSKRSRQM
jgi:hypothetical protein